MSGLFALPTSEDGDEAADALGGTGEEHVAKLRREADDHVGARLKFRLAMDQQDDNGAASALERLESNVSPLQVQLAEQAIELVASGEMSA